MFLSYEGYLIGHTIFGASGLLTFGAATAAGRRHSRLLLPSSLGMTGAVVMVMVMACLGVALADMNGKWVVMMQIAHFIWR